MQGTRSVGQQSQARKPADQQRPLRGGGLGCCGTGFLFGPLLLEWDGGAAVEIRVDVAPAPSDVVCATHQMSLCPRPGEAVRGRGAFFNDGRNPLVTEIPAKSFFPFPPVTSRSGKRIHNPHPVGVCRHGQGSGLAIGWCFLSHFCG